MKTAVRIQEFKSDVEGIGLATIQILDREYKGGSLKPIGHIQFQRSLKDGINGEWYGLTYKLDTHNTSDLRKMNKIADKIVAKCKELGKSSWEMQPVDVLDALNAERYGVFKHDFYPLSCEHKLLFDVMLRGEVYTRVVGLNEKEATKEMKKLKLNGAELAKASYVITF